METVPTANGYQKSKAFLLMLDRIAFTVVVAGAMLALVVALAGIVLLVTPGAAAADLPPTGANHGGLLLRSDGRPQAVPLLDTEAHIQVSGMIARATVRQVFSNPYDEWQEGIYVFPLPENAAVDHLKMQIGERVVEGQIQERTAARATYQAARQSGRRSTLVEQERPNIFTTSVANIGPRQHVVVEIQYQQTLRYEESGGAGRVSLRFPMVVAPRYIPGAPVDSRQGAGWSADRDQVPDASRITPPVLRPGEDAPPANPIRIKVDLDAGAAVTSVDSPHHAVHMQVLTASRVQLELASGTTPADRDFELTWRLERNDTPRASIFTEELDGTVYALLMLLPPTVEEARQLLRREVVFVIDTSGSMEGSSIIQARKALEMAITRLRDGDRFNIIEFNSSARALFAGAVSSDQVTRRHAVEFVRGLRAHGGTEMEAALALALDGRQDPWRVRQIVFLTDGAVGNEEPLFRLIREGLGDSRLFTVGIGSAPNGYFMTKAADAGRGSFTYIGKVEEVGEKMAALFSKLESPALKGIELEWPDGVQVETWPARIPDLYLGEALIVSAAFTGLPGSVRVSGLRGSDRWQIDLPLDEALPGTGMGVLWARAKIGSLVSRLREGADENEVRRQVVDVALAHHLVSKYTSLVAVDKTPVRPEGEKLVSAILPANLPQGWNYDSVFGELPRGATDSRWHALAGGAASLLAGALFWGCRRRRRHA